MPESNAANTSELHLDPLIIKELGRVLLPSEQRLN